MTARRLTDDQIRQTVAALTSGTPKAKAALLANALAGDHDTLVALRFWARRLGVTS